MAVLSADSPRTGIEFMNGGIIVDAQMEESQTIFRGSAVGLDAGDQFAQPLETGDVFLGIAIEQVTSGAVGGVETCKVQVGGAFELPVASVAITDVGASVSATDDNTFVVAGAAESTIGRIIHVPATGTAWVMLKTPGEAQGAAQTLAASVT